LIGGLEGQLFGGNNSVSDEVVGVFFREVAVIGRVTGAGVTAKQETRRSEARLVGVCGRLGRIKNWSGLRKTGLPE